MNKKIAKFWTICEKNKDRTTTELFDPVMVIE